MPIAVIVTMMIRIPLLLFVYNFKTILRNINYNISNNTFFLSKHISLICMLRRSHLYHKITGLYLCTLICNSLDWMAPKMSSTLCSSTNRYVLVISNDIKSSSKSLNCVYAMGDSLNGIQFNFICSDSCIFGWFFSDDKD